MSNPSGAGLPNGDLDFEQSSGKGFSRRAVIGAASVAGTAVALAGGLTAILGRAEATPTFDGATGWLNSPPLSSGQLRGKVVVADFWTLTCINWIRTAPYLRAWSQAYRDDGLLVIGVHTPEFSFEHDVGRVRRAIRERAIDYPVALDNSFAIWQAFDNHYWPARYCLDKDGRLADTRVGEGEYAESEHALQDLLGVRRKLAPVAGAGVEAAPDWNNLRSPETYLGYGRGTNFHSLPGAVPDARTAYELPPELILNSWGLEGQWTVEREKVVHGGVPGAGIAHRFHARDVHLVMSAGGRGPIPFRVLLDGRVPGPSHGVDVDEDGNGTLDDGRLYQLVRTHGTVNERLVEIVFDAPGAEAYAFTFG